MRFKKDTKKGVSYLFIIPFFVLLIVIVLIDSQIRPLVRKVAAYQSRIIATEIISSAVYRSISGEDFGYSSLVTLSTGEDGYVSSVESNMLEINKLQAIITNSVNDSFKDLTKETITISTGTLSGFDLFYERGPELHFKLKPVGYVEVRLVSKFSSSGINQTLHQIILEVHGTVSAIIPGYSTEVDVASSYIIAETVIVGRIPDSYTYITGDTRDNISKIMDLN